MIILYVSSCHIFDEWPDFRTSSFTAHIVLLSSFTAHIVLLSSLLFLNIEVS